MSDLSFRLAGADDVPELVRMLAEDPLGRSRERFEDPLPEAYNSAFAEIDDDPRQQLVVAELDGRVVGMLQLTTIPYLTYRGRPRALVEGVRVDAAHRGKRIGRALMEEAIQRARDAGCHLIQLTTDKRRSDALEFYRALGFESSHEGMKLHL